MLSSLKQGLKAMKPQGEALFIVLADQAEILQLSGETGASEILARHPKEILTLEMNQDAVIIDVDTEEDYLKYRERSRISS